MRWIYRLFLMVLIVLLLTLGGSWLTLRGSLPRYDGAVRATELSAPVSIERDALGTATLHAQNRQDLSYALGYVHAQERFFEMDLMRRRAAGELSELFGPAALPADREARAHRMRARASEVLLRLPENDLALIDAYRNGVNKGMTDLKVRPFPYLLTATQPAPWRSEDTILVIDSMFFTLNDSDNSRELAFSRMHAALPESAYRFLTANGGNWDAPLAGPAFAWPEPPTATELNIHALTKKSLGALNVPKESISQGSSQRTHGSSLFTVSNSDFHRYDEYPSFSDANIPGSNSFAVSGALTGGAALVANDMHLDLRVPNIWFRARFVYSSSRRAGHTVDVMGATLPGTPAMVVGTNRQVAWTFTNSEADCTDWVRIVIDPQDANRYRSANGWKPIATHAETIHIRGATDEIVNVRETEWGPILAKDTDGTPLALAWTAQQPDAVNLGLMQLEQAETADEAVTIAQQAGMPPENFIVGDRHGNISWTIAGRIPRRVGNYDPQLPSDWSVPGTGWDGWLDSRNYPLISNPRDQRLWTANARVIADPWLARLGDAGYDIGGRARQIRDDLKQKDHFTPADMLNIQLDDRALFLTPWKDLLDRTLANADASPLHDKLKQALKDWNGRAAPESVAYRLVREFRNEVHATVLNGFAVAVQNKFPEFTLPRISLVENAVWTLLRERPAHLLPAEYTDWNALLIACIDQVGQKLDAQPGGIAARTWGEANTLKIRHPLAGALPEFVARFLNMPPQPISGDSNMPRVERTGFGASERFAVAPGDEEHGYFEMPGGQSGHPLSAHYGAGHQEWVEGKPTPLMPGQSQHKLILEPKPNH